jgi:hypothetical protein
MLLSKINSDSLRVRMLQGSLLLVGALVFYINSLHSRPDDGSYARKLCRAIFPLTIDTESPNLLIRTRNRDEGEGIPYAIGGVMYLRDILLKPTGSTYRFSEVKLIDEDVFNYMIGCTPDDVTRYLFRAGIQRHTRVEGYVGARKGYTKTRAAREREDLDRQFPDLAGVVEELVAETEEGHPAPPEEIRVGDTLERILQQYASDIMQKCGNPRGREPAVSYCHLVQYERQHISFEDINTLDLGRFFNQIQWRRATPDDWDQAFDRLFPIVTHVDTFSTAHFGNCRYYQTYRELLLKLTEERCDEIREALRNKIAELVWIPSTKSDRLWDYTAGDRTWTKVPDRNQRGPRILVNPRSGGQVNMANGLQEDARVLEGLEEDAAQARAMARREEEEEDEDEGIQPAALRQNSNRRPSRETTTGRNRNHHRIPGDRNRTGPSNNQRNPMPEDRNRAGPSNNQRLTIPEDRNHAGPSNNQRHTVPEDGNPAGSTNNHRHPSPGDRNQAGPSRQKNNDIELVGDSDSWEPLINWAWALIDEEGDTDDDIYV